MGQRMELIRQESEPEVWTAALRHFKSFQGPATDHWWLVESEEARLTSERPLLNELSPATIHHLFTSPLYVTEPFRPQEVARATNQKLTAAALHLYRQFLLQHHPEGAPLDGKLNNQFFQWQLDEQDKAMNRVDQNRFGSAFPELHALPEFQILRNQVREHMKRFLQRYARPSILPQDQPHLYCWFSVHRGPSLHTTHIHDDSIVSGVYYVQTPTKAAPLAFSDPRGWPAISDFSDSLPFPPFVLHHNHVPSAGQLILFPSWLPHGVRKGNASDYQDKADDDDGSYRISLAFNMVGDWFGLEGSSFNEQLG
eukprot:c9248_g1_i1.p1 GENE.c9248_g1_i1~~c9248_g1_i1.p1  ORF type:complete len:328 (+),score=57.79 c9248_g1_i1:54-986(+)